MLVELKNGETLNGHLVSCDTWMNLTMKEVVQTSPEADKFMRLPEVYVKGNNVGQSPPNASMRVLAGYAANDCCEGMLTEGVHKPDQIPTGARRDHRHSEGPAGWAPIELPGRSWRRASWRIKRGPWRAGRRR